MPGVDGQGTDGNIFALDWMTMLPAPDNVRPQRVATKFSESTPLAFGVGLSDFGAVNPLRRLNRNQGDFPFMLRLEPGEDVKNRFAGTVFDPNASDFDPYEVFDQLVTIEPGTKIFNVYGLSAPTQLGGTETKIGEIILDPNEETGFTPSRFGDNEHMYWH